jgi:hypothetical protein
MGLGKGLPQDNVGAAAAVFSGYFLIWGLDKLLKGQGLRFASLMGLDIMSG